MTSKHSKNFGSSPTMPSLILIFMCTIVTMPATWAATVAETTAAFNGAIKEPDKEALNQLLSVLPSVTLPNGISNYIVEGDLRVSRDQLRVYLDDLRTRKTTLKNTWPKLQLHEVDNEPDYLRTLQSRRLTYSIARASFTPDEYTKLIREMKEATTKWMEICPLCQIRFEHKPEYDSSPSPSKTNFILQKLDSGGAFLVSAFFPSTAPAERYFFIDPLYFSVSSRVGVLEHSLGHLLGYRHQHTEEIIGCAQQNGKWMPLHNEQTESVMQPVCSGGNVNLKLESRDDIESHLCVYNIQYAQDHVNTCRRVLPSQASSDPLPGPPPDPQSPFGSGPALRVRFHGGEIAENIVRVVELLLNEKLIKSMSYQVVEGDYACRIYKRVMDWPAKVLCPDSLLRLAARLNNVSTRALSRLTPGQMIQVVPRLVFIPYPSATASFSAPQPGQWEVPSRNPDRRKEFVYYELHFPWPDVAKLTRVNSIINGGSRINGWPKPFLFSDIDPGGNRLPPLHQDPGTNDVLNHITPAEFVNRCTTTTGNRMRNVRAWYARLISAAGLDKCVMTCPPEGCVEVMLLDSLVQPHPNLKGAIVHPPNMEFTEGNDDCMEVHDPGDPLHHGTMMAGIIGARETQYPFVGIAPASQIYSLDLRGKQNADVGFLITGYLDGPRRVFVMASSYSTGGRTQTQDRRLLIDHEDRQTRGNLGDVVGSNRFLLITAIGQPSEKIPAFNMSSEIFKKSDFSPANLGDKEHVVVVTSCSDCSSDENAQLDARAHYSQQDRLVHLAAPGQDIPALASATKLIHRVKGTSPATAFVAGVAAAMMNCHPTKYDEAYKVKSRLQLTARPVLRGDDALKVQGGIIDADLALKNPSLTWLKRRNSGYESVQVVAWCASSITLTDPSSRDIVSEGSTMMSHVLRLYRLQTPTQDGERYVVFKKPSRAGMPPDAANAWRHGAMFHTAPGLPSIKGKLLKLSTGESVAIEEVDDLVLDKAVAETSSC